jgi:hypothetical protein
MRMMNRRMVLSLAGLLAMSLAGFAQERKEVDVLVGTPPAMPVHAQAIHILGAATMDGKVVKNMPYSAEASTEMTRVLADGTRIVNRHTTTMARDKEGRTRREDNLANVGPFANRSEQAPRTATIVDPVANETMILNLNEKTAHKIAVGKPMFFRSEKTSPGGGREIREERVQIMVRDSSVSSSAGATTEKHMVHGVVGQAAGPDTFHLPAPPMAGPGAMFMRYDSRNSKSESLGKQVMEGVEVEGTRVTTTIPAGEIGNDRPIVSVSERWYSNELQMVIYSKTTDPQFGETVYRVSNLRRTEPGADLFRVPADFKIQEPQGGPGPRPIMIQRELKQ